MNILPINDFSSKDRSTVFKSCFRQYPAKYLTKFDTLFGQNVIKNSTNIFREDIDWKTLQRYVLFHFHDAEKVNTYSLACSDGSEAYSFAVSIINKLPKTLQDKYLPIFASDVDSDIIKFANSRRINIFDYEFYYAQKNYNINLNDYFIEPKTPIILQNDDIDWTNNVHSYLCSQELKDAVYFKQSDILTELSKINDSGNSIIFCRNVFPYLNDKYIDNIVEMVSKVLKPGSLFITGDYDKRTPINEKLCRSGFYQPLIYQNNIYQRGDIRDMLSRLTSGYLI